MRLSYLLTSIAFLAVSAPCRAIDWQAFDDPKAFVLTDPMAKSIGALPDSEKTAAIQRLQDSLKSKEVEVRRRAAMTLDKLGDKSGVPTMIADLPQTTGRDHDNVAVSLRILKDDRAIPVLREALKDKSPYVRGIAVAALGEIKAKKAYDEIVVLTKDKEDQSGKKAGDLNCFRIYPADMACYALGALGDERAIPVLIERMSDAELRNSAKQALKALTKQDLGDDPEKWQAWWNDQAR